MEPPAHGRLARLADFSYRRRWRVLGAWIATLLVALAASTAFGGDLTVDYSTPGSDSEAAATQIEKSFPGGSTNTVDVVWEARDATSAAATERASRVLAEAQRLPGLGDGVTVQDAELSRDGTIAVARIPITEPRADDVPMATGERLLEIQEQASGDGVRFEMGGQPVSNAQAGELSSEVVGMAIAALVLLVTFGTVTAAGLPLATALFGLGVGSALVAVLASFMDVADWVPSVAAMIGIGVGIDYALLIITRYRAALGRGLEPREATVEAITTAGRSVLIAGTTVVIALMGLFLMGLGYLYGFAVGAILAVLVVMAASVTLLPAMLGFAKRRIDALRVPFGGRAPADPNKTFAARWSRGVQRRPLVGVVAGTAVLLALAAPALGLRLGLPDASNDQTDTTTRQAYDLMAKGFGPGSAGPLMVVAQTGSEGDHAKVAVLADRARSEAGVAAVSEPQVSPDGNTTLLLVTPASSPQSEATEELIHTLRDNVVPGSGLAVDVGGLTASLVDQSEATASRLPVFVGTVVGLSFLLLLVAFRAPVVALKAGVMNLLSIGAAYGVVALAADGGFVGGLIGIDTATPVPPFIPVMMFAILFGLSMDYEVFLLSRVREEFLRGGGTSRAVRDGLAKTARVITAAAAIMVAVFGAFVLSPDVSLKLIGLGLAAAIAIDATIVRMVLVPAVMQMLGERNWWLPAWLDRVVPHTEVEAPSAA